MTPYYFKPTIIIGAARSGTNILRDALTRLPSFGTWPCDEINLTWRHGNRDYSTDEFPTSLATSLVKKNIRQEFEKIARRYKVNYVVEKTCANVLRVGFVHEIFPDARFIWLVRDGRDVTASAMKRWVAPMDWRYTLKKARFVPLSDLPYYGWRFFRNRMHQLRNPDRKLATWGPKFAGMDLLVQTVSLAEVCAHQWTRSIEKSNQDFSAIPPERIYKLSYEDFARFPTKHLHAIASFLEVGFSDEIITQATLNVHDTSIGNWEKNMEDATLLKIFPILANSLHLLGYD